MMRLTINKTMKFALVGVACVAFCTPTASGDIQVFWKASVCPSFGTKGAIGEIAGFMQAPVDKAADASSITGVGGPFCYVPGLGVASATGGQKAYDVYNANVVWNDPANTGREGELYNCVICQYEVSLKSTAAIPAISLFGTVILMAGLLTAGAYRIGKRQQGEAAA